MIKNFIFDFGNVLTKYDWGSFAVELSGDESMRELMPKLIFSTKLWRKYDAGLISEDDLISQFKEQTDSKYHALIEEMIKTFDTDFEQYDEMVPVLKRLKDCGANTFLLSNFPAKKYEQVAAKCPILDYVDNKVVSAYIHLTKPDKDIFEYLLNKYSLDAKECIFVDDHQPNVETAMSLGMQGHVFTDADSFVRKLESLNIF